MRKQSSRLNVQVVSRGVRGPKAVALKMVSMLTQELSRESLNRRAQARLKSAESLVIAFVDEAAIARLNKGFRGKARPTDVLSFSPVELGSLGELVIAMDVIRRQAKEHKVTMNEELLYMLLHGLLHLLGYDHGPRMFGIQDRVFERLRDRF